MNLSSSLTHRPQASNRPVNVFNPPKSQLQPARRPNGAPPTGPSVLKPVRVSAGGSTEYESTCKRALTRRLKRTFAFSFVASWAITAVTAYLTAGFYLLPSFASLLSTFVASLLVFTFAVLPTLVLRKSLISQPEATTTSLFSRISLLLSLPATHTTTLVFLTCAVIQALVWSVVTEVSKPEARLGVFASTSKHPFHLNERLILVLLSNLSLGVAYASRELLTEAFIPHWPKDLLPIPGLLTDRLAALPFCLTLPAVHSVVFSAIYVFFRKTAFRFILSWFGIIARPYIANFLRPSHFPLDLRLFSRMVVLQSATVLGWEVGKAVLQVYMVQPMTISQNSTSPPRFLLEGSALSSPYFRHHALFELSHLSITSSKLRAAIFTDMTVSPTTGRTTWDEVWRSQMVLLGNSYQKLLRRGAPPPSSLASSLSSSTTSPSSAAPSAHSAGSPLRARQDSSIFLHPEQQASFLSSSSTASTVPSSPSPARQVLVSTGAPSGPLSKVPSIFTKDASPLPPTTASVPAPVRRAANGQGFVTMLGQAFRICWRLLSKEQRSVVESRLIGFRRVQGREMGKGVMRQSLAGKEESVLVVQTLAALLSASLSEDPYGQVQRTIPRTLEALLAYHEALETFLAEKSHGVAGAGLGEVEREEMRLVLVKEVGGVVEATRSAIRQIAQTFGEHLSAFKMPVAVVKQLEAVVAE